jgi:coatomer subunit beta
LVASDPQLLAAELGSSQAPEDSSDTIPGVLTSLSGLSKNSASLFTQRLNKAVAMTGLADSVYIEGFLRLHSFDLILELYIVNRTGETLQNILVELCTNGDLKVVEKPNAVTLGPGETATVYSTIRVSSTENGTIFGYATLDRKSALDKEWIVLNEVHADVVDYIVPKSSIMEASFKDMWQEFEWENKIVVNTCTNNPSEFIDMLCKCTNLCLVGTEEQVHVTKQLIDKSQFIAVNLYAKSIFDEDALVNVSIEKEADGRLAGTVRIRARNQGIALSLGDKVNQIQKDQLRGA